jgi:hypothetical protein
MSKTCSNCKNWKRLPWNEEDWGTCTFSYSHKDEYIPPSSGAALNTIKDLTCEEWKSNGARESLR